MNNVSIIREKREEKTGVVLLCQKLHWHLGNEKEGGKLRGMF
jgi:hypothetical protein